MRLFICCDQKGNIISTAKVTVLAEGLEHPYADLAEGEMVVEIEPTAELWATDCHEIAERYRIDPKTKKLKKKPRQRGRTKRG